MPSADCSLFRNAIIDGQQIVCIYLASATSVSTSTFTVASGETINAV